MAIEVLRNIANIRSLLKDEAEKFVDTLKTWCKKDAQHRKESKELNSIRPTQGKYLFALKEEFETLRNPGKDEQGKQKAVPSTVIGRTFAEYVEAVVGAKPNNHAYSCSNAFEMVVRGIGGLTEDHYDKASGNATEKLSRIRTNCEKTALVRGAGEDALWSHPALVEAIKVYMDRTDAPVKYSALLQQIIERFVVDETSEDGDGETLIYLDASQKKESDIRSSILLANATLADAAHLTIDAEMAKLVVEAIVVAQTMFARNVDENGARRFSPEQLAAWANAKTLQLEKAAADNAPVQFNHGPAPETAPAETPAEVAA